MTEAVIIEQNNIGNVWPLVKDYIGRCDHKRFNSNDIYDCLLESTLSLVMVYEDSILKGACIFKVSNVKKKKILITVLGGDGANWDNAIKDFSRQLLERGFKRLEIQGRRGWLKALNDFDELHTTIGKDL